MNIKPLFDRVIIEDFEVEQQTSHGLYIPSSAQEKPNFAKVIAVGDGGIVEGTETKMSVRPGDKIVYSKFAGVEYKFKDKIYTIIRQADILAIIEEEEWAKL